MVWKKQRFGYLVKGGAHDSADHFGVLARALLGHGVHQRLLVQAAPALQWRTPHKQVKSKHRDTRILERKKCDPHLMIRITRSCRLRL